MKKIKKILTFFILVFINVILLAIIVLNNSVYTFDKAQDILLNKTCKSVYYEPYSIFSYRTLIDNYGWLLTNGEIVHNIIPPGSDVSLNTDEDFSTGEISYNILVGDNLQYIIEEKDYEYLKEKGISDDYEHPTSIDYFIVEEGNYEEGTSEKIYQKEDVLGKIKACKE